MLFKEYSAQMSVSQRQEANLSYDMDTGLTYWHTFFTDLFLTSKWFKLLDPLKSLPCKSSQAFIGSVPQLSQFFDQPLKQEMEQLKHCFQIWKL